MKTYHFANQKPMSEDTYNKVIEIAPDISDGLLAVITDSKDGLHVKDVQAPSIDKALTYFRKLLKDQNIANNGGVELDSEMVNEQVETFFMWLMDQPEGMALLDAIWTNGNRVCQVNIQPVDGKLAIPSDKDYLNDLSMKKLGRGWNRINNTVDSYEAEIVEHLTNQKKNR